MSPWYHRQKNKVQFYRLMYNSKQCPGNGPGSKAELAPVRGHGEVCWPRHCHLPPELLPTSPQEPAGEAALTPLRSHGKVGAFLSCARGCADTVLSSWAQTQPCASLKALTTIPPQPFPCETLSSSVRKLWCRKTKEHIRQQFSSFTLK